MDRQGRVVGFTSVVGDLFHAGHMEMIQECRQHCDYLIVAVMAGTEPIREVLAGTEHERSGRDCGVRK